MMKELVENISSNDVKIKSLIADGAYDSDENFGYLQKKKIRSAIKMKRNSIVSPKNNRIRNMKAKQQTKDQMEEEKKIWI